jgi:precorrin-6B C5,15-methyltransferase / cobalt-precorrin-6B C5,C15-methyltransferase
VRALTLSALAPRPGEVLWDIGTGSGSVAIEFLLSASGTQAFALEADAVRGARAEANAARFGLGHRFHLRVNKAPDGIADLPSPDVVFIGGGASEAVFQAVWTALPVGARLVANAVTLESEALLMRCSAEKGGHLLRIDLAEPQSLGGKRGWKAAYPVVQWSVQR